MGQKERLKLFCLWTKVHHLFSANVGGVVVDQLLFQFSISGSIPEIFAIKVDSCLKSRQTLDVFCPPKFSGAGLLQKLGLLLGVCASKPWSVPEIFVIAVDSCLKPHRILDVFALQNFRGRAFPKNSAQLNTPASRHVAWKSFVTLLPLAPKL